MSLKCLIATGLTFVTLASPAVALEGTLQGLGGMNMVVVWKNKDAQHEGMSLIEAGVLQSNPELVIPYVSCIVPTGTRAIITDAGLATHDVMVIEGESAGCKGNIPMEAWK